MRAAEGVRKTASTAGRKQGSKRRSTCSRKMRASCNLCNSMRCRPFGPTAQPRPFLDRPGAALSRVAFLRFWTELDAVVNLRQRQGGFNLAQRDDGIQPLVHFADKALLRAAERDGGGRLLLEKDVNRKRRDRQVGVLLLAQVHAPRSAREDLEDRCRLVLERIALGI